MLILVTTAHTTLCQHPDPDGAPVHRNLGRLLQPRHTSRAEATATEGIPWAADNDCFNGLDSTAFARMLDRLKGLPGCRFVAVPDVLRCGHCDRTVDGYGVDRGGFYKPSPACECKGKQPLRYGDARLTAHRFEAWAPGLERRGLPVALVLQDGIDEPQCQLWLARTWHRLDAVFVGGSTGFKLGPVPARLLAEAKRRGLWTHVGRVNTRKRFDHFASLGTVDSIDGTQFARWRKTHLDEGLSWTLDPNAGAQLTLAA